MTTTIPDGMPVLSSGAHASPQEGACAMEYLSLLTGDQWTDKPQCTDGALTAITWSVNDCLDADDRHLILDALPRLARTGRIFTNYDDHRRFFDSPLHGDLALATAHYRVARDNADVHESMLKVREAGGFPPQAVAGQAERLDAARLWRRHQAGRLMATFTGVIALFEEIYGITEPAPDVDIPALVRVYQEATA